MIKMWENFNTDSEIDDLKNIFSDISDDEWDVTIGFDRKMSDNDSNYFIVNIFIKSIPSVGIGNPFSNESINDEIVGELELVKREFDRSLKLQSQIIETIKRIISNGYKILSYHSVINSNIPRIQINLKLDD